MRVSFGILGCLAAGLTLQGCAAPRMGGSGARVYAVDLAGAAKLCEPGKADPQAGQAVDVALKMINDNGWCAVSVSRGGGAYDAGLLTERPSHGRVSIKTVGDATRIDYTPHAGFAGADKFAVRLVPTDAVLRITANVGGK
jgi:hypothetical protein